MTTQMIEKWAWVLIYGGLGLFVLGLFVRPTSAWMGWAFIAVGAVGTVAGAVFIVVRSRMDDPPDAGTLP